jgi:N-acetylglucosaminylphosphatidylinositol deacetylase
MAHITHTNTGNGTNRAIQHQHCNPSPFPFLFSHLFQIITFDEFGISYHPNHISIFQACHSLPSVEVYTLQSVPLWRKYISIFDTLYVFTRKHPSDRVIYVNRPGGTFLVQKAMRRGHRSQMLWFRWGWILFSRYLIVNELDLIPGT